jgi:hypothetical protein
MRNQVFKDLDKLGYLVTSARLIFSIRDVLRPSVVFPFCITVSLLQYYSSKGAKEFAPFTYNPLRYNNLLCC